MQPRQQPKKRRSHRGLLVIVLVIGALAFGWVHIVHGSSAAKPKQPALAACTRSSHTRHTTHHARACMSRVHKHASASPLHTYAVALARVLSRSRTVFDQASAAVQTTDLETLGTVCGTYGDEITLLEAQVDGVPHPGPWYYAVSRLHFTLLGEFHDMLGALQTCQTASENQDSGTASVAQGDVASADQRLRASDDYTVSLAHAR